MTNRQIPIPRKRQKPRRKVHPVQPWWALDLRHAEMLQQRAKKALKRREKVYFGGVASLPCCLALNWGQECKGRTTVAHKDGAGMALKAPYPHTFACCQGHHLADFGPNSIGKMGVKGWERKYGPQDKYIAVTQYRLKLKGFKFEPGEEIE